MTQQEEIFVQQMASLFYYLAPDRIALDTRFKELKAWNLLFAVSCVVMVEEEYRVLLSDSDLLHTETVKDLYHLIKEKL